MPGLGFCVTTILTPADPSWGLVDKAAFKAELGVTGSAQDAYILALIAQATAAIGRHCNRCFAPETLADRIAPQADPYPWQVPSAPGPVALSRFPILGSVAILADGIALVEGADVLTDPALGQVHRLNDAGAIVPWTATTIVATYTAGFATAPPDLADAATRLMKARWFARARDPGLRSETIPGVVEQAFWFGTGPGASGALPPDVEGLLAPWRLPALA